MRLANHTDESTRHWRALMIEETCRFIEWGLEHPDEVAWIPAHPVGKGGFSERVKWAFWSLVAQSDHWPGEP